jgi:pyrimidine-nucleoside phosphorylase
MEVLECIEILRGDRHPMSEDLRVLSLELSAWMFYLGRKTDSVESGRALAEEMITSGKALNKFRDMARCQGGGDISVVDRPNRLPAAAHAIDFAAGSSGFITSVNCEQVGLSSLILGGGRSKKEDVIDHAVGLLLHKKVGDEVRSGETLATVYYNADARLAESLTMLRGAYQISAQPPADKRPLVHRIIGGK